MTDLMLTDESAKRPVGEFTDRVEYLTASAGWSAPSALPDSVPDSVLRFMPGWKAEVTRRRRRCFRDRHPMYRHPYFTIETWECACGVYDKFVLYEKPLPVP